MRLGYEKTVAKSWLEDFSMSQDCDMQQKTQVYRMKIPKRLELLKAQLSGTF